MQSNRRPKTIFGTIDKRVVDRYFAEIPVDENDRDQRRQCPRRNRFNHLLHQARPPSTERSEEAIKNDGGNGSNCSRQNGRAHDRGWIV